MTCCFTGHRYFSWGNNTGHPQHKTLLAKLEKAIDLAFAKGATHFICGNAIGVDTWAAELVLKKEKSTSANFSGDRAAFCRSQRE